MRYEGFSKWWTADCGECPYRHEGCCYWGKYVKHLSTNYPVGTEHEVRRCEFRNRQPAGDSAWCIRFRKGRGTEKPAQGRLPLEASDVDS